MKPIIALVAGGYSGEYVISVQSAKTIENNVDPERFTVYKIFIDRNGWFHETASGEKINVDRNDFSLTLNGQKITFDGVFIGIHGTPGEDGKLQGYFDMLNIPYTSCDAICSALTFNKFYCNKVVADFGVVNIARSRHYFRHSVPAPEVILAQLSLPVFVKPNEGGSSIGMSRVNTAEELPAALEKAFKEDRQIIIEEFIGGREFTVGVFNNHGTITALPITEVRAGKEFFDFEAKYTPGVSQEITPAQIDAATTELIQSTARGIYERLNCKGVIRIDFIQREDGKLFMLEVNTMPGQSENSIVPQQVRAAGMTLQTFYGTLIDACLNK